MTDAATGERRWEVREDREIHVRPDQTVRTAWVGIDDCVLGSKFRRSIGDVERKYRKLLQMGDSNPFPPVTGYFNLDRFVILDGGHTYLAALILGRDRLLVAWLESGDT